VEKGLVKANFHMAIPLGQWRSHVFRAAGCRKPNKQGAVSYNDLFINQPYLQTEGVTARDVCVCVRWLLYFS
jgi:hypothetical protein